MAPFILYLNGCEQSSSCSSHYPGGGIPQYQVNRRPNSSRITERRQTVLWKYYAVACYKYRLVFGTVWGFCLLCVKTSVLKDSNEKQNLLSHFNHLKLEAGINNV
jgi:hypothetical protein